MPSIFHETMKVNEINGTNDLGVTIEGVTIKDGEIIGFGSNIIPVTLPDMLILKNNSELLPSQWYQISGVDTNLYNDGTNSGTTILLQAVAPNKLSINGYGIFYNPKYTTYTVGFDIWNNVSSLFSNVISGTFIAQENITANNGATGQLFATVRSSLFIALTGNWNSAVSFTGNSSGASANIVFRDIVSYPVNTKVIWGGYSWTNLTGLVGNKLDEFNLDSNWSKDVYDEVNYNVVVDIIKYDCENDIITRRCDKFENDICYSYGDLPYLPTSNSPIKAFQFGNNDGINSRTGNKVYNSYCESINCPSYLFSQNQFMSLSAFYNNRFTYKNSNTQGIYGVTLLWSVCSNNTFNGQTSLRWILFNYITTFQYNIIPDSLFGNNTFANYTFITNNTFENSTFQYCNVNYGSITSNKFEKGASPIGVNFQACNIVGGAISSNTIGAFSNFLNTSLIHTQLVSCNFVGSSINDSICNLSSFAITINNKLIRYLIAERGNISGNYNSATIIFGNYSKKLISRQDGTTRIQYINNSDVSLIVPSTT
jgi:hypothetical protein